MLIQLHSVEKLLLVLAATIIPFYFTDFRLYLPGAIIRLADLFSILIIGLYFILARYQRISWHVPSGYQIVFVFVAYCVLLGLFKSSVKDTLVESVQWAMLLTVVGIVYGQSIKHPAEFQSLLFKALLGICAFVVLYHFATGHFVRYKSLGDSKYIFALTGVLLIGHMYFNNSKQYLLPLLILYPFILLSLERKGILAFHVVLLIFAIMTYRFAFKAFLIALLSGGLLYLFFTPNLADFSAINFFSYNESEIYYLDEEAALWTSNLHRQSLLMFGWDIFEKNMLWGVGPKMLVSEMVDYFYNPDLAIYTHNVFLDTLIEYGLVGLFLLLLPYVIFLLKTNLNNTKKRVYFLSLIVYSTIMLFFMAGGAASMLLLYLPLCLGFVFNPASNEVNDSDNDLDVDFDKSTDNRNPTLKAVEA